MSAVDRALQAKWASEGLVGGHVQGGNKVMLNAMTLFAAVNNQSDLEQANVEQRENIQAFVVNESDSGREGNVVESVAEELSSAFGAFEGALGSIFGASESPATPVRNKKITL